MTEQPEAPETGEEKPAPAPRIVCRMAGAPTAKMMSSEGAVLAAVLKEYPQATQKDEPPASTWALNGVVVAASIPIRADRPSRYWLAIRPK